jgi:hypothetical protein
MNMNKLNIPKSKEEIAVFSRDIAELKKQVAALQQSVQSLKKLGLNEDVLIYIIQQSAKKYHIGTPISAKLIRYILQGIETLEEYLFKKESE